VLASLALMEKDYARARPATVESLDANLALGSKEGISVSLQALAVLAVYGGRPEDGVRLAGTVDMIREGTGGEAPPRLVGLEDPGEAARAFLAEDRIAELREEGRAMTLEEAVALARRAASEPTPDHRVTSS
jgi:hypothetical protein